MARGRQKGGAGLNTGQNVLECKLNVAGIESRRLDEGQVILACPNNQHLSVSSLVADTALGGMEGRLTRKCLGLLCWHSS